MSPRAVVPLVSVPVLLLALVGCTTPETTTPTSTASSTASQTPGASTPPEETTAPPSSSPVEIPCSSLVSAQAIYDFNPNFSLIDSWTPESGTAGATALAAEGSACRWQNDTNGETIDVAVASFDTATLESLANDAYTNSTMVPTYGPEAYFTVSDGIGEAIIFDRSYWVVVSSSYFLEPGDAEPIVAPVLEALP